MTIRAARASMEGIANTELICVRPRATMDLARPLAAVKADGKS